MALLLAGIGIGIAGAANIDVFRGDNFIAFNATEGIVSVPISGQNMSVEGIPLPDLVHLCTDGEMLAVIGEDGHVIATPFHEGTIYITGQNMSVLYDYYADDVPGWTFLLNSDPLAIIAVAGEMSCECAECGCAEAA